MDEVHIKSYQTLSDSQIQDLQMELLVINLQARFLPFRYVQGISD